MCLSFFQVIWRKKYFEATGEVKDLIDLVSLAKVSDGYTGGQIAKACANLSSESQDEAVEVPSQGIKASELIAELAKMDPVYQEEEEAFKVRIIIIHLLQSWYAKTPLSKKRAKMMEEEAAGGGASAGGTKGKKKGGKKKKKKK
ncbi:Dynein regulatory complex protein 11 [Cichlidogyrus casuarinus]|uniref:Dynein regulatory complex protein 11 n=1 Tax=Cichlidogyrus casuarinus TaxID=1844966 RepID=A0ABD2Q1L8_9PLAT